MSITFAIMLGHGSARKDPTNQTKAETYEAMAVINRSFEQIMSALYRLESKGVLGDDYPDKQELVLREISAKSTAIFLHA